MAILIQAVGASALAFHGSFIQILSVSFVVDWTFKVLLIGSLLYKNRGAEPRGLAAAWLPASWCVVVSAVVVMAAVCEPRSAALGLLLAGAGLPLRWLWKRFALKHSTGNEHALRGAKLMP